jgi:hypothetical protein
MFQQKPKTTLPPPHNNTSKVNIGGSVQTQTMQQPLVVQHSVLPITVKIFLPYDEVRKINVQNMSLAQLSGQILSFLPTIIAINEDTLKVIRKRHLLLYYQDEDEDWIRFDREQEWKDALQKTKQVLKVRVRFNEALIEKDKNDPPEEEEESSRQTPIPESNPFVMGILQPQQNLQQQQQQQQVQQFMYQSLPQGMIPQSKPVFVSPTATTTQAQKIPQPVYQMSQVQQPPLQSQPIYYPTVTQPQPQIDYTQILNRLHEMGFNNDAKSIELLRQFNGNAESVINWYLTNEK